MIAFDVHTVRGLERFRTARLFWVLKRSCEQIEKRFGGCVGKHHVFEYRLNILFLAGKRFCVVKRLFDV